MGGQELAVEQGEALGLERCNQMDQCDLGGIARAGKHALAEECRSKPHSIKAAYQGSRLIANFQTVGMAAPVQGRIQRLDRLVDPGVKTSRRCRRTSCQHSLEIGVGGNLIRLPAHRPGQPAWNVEAVERQDPPVQGIDKEQPGIIAPVRHGENPACIAIQQGIRPKGSFTH
jgi:hypothetical protein